MPVSQQQINYGNTANDGQGDPLRTAFIKTDDNFDAIWAAGPVGTNVTIVNNTISTVDTNGDLTISANGVGMVRTNSSLVPAFANALDLGSANLRYRSLFVGTGGATISGNIAVSNANITTSFGLPVYANTTARDAAISSPQPGMMVFVTGTGLQVRGSATWNTITGTAT